MDPHACLVMVLEALATNDREAAIDSMGDLAEWLGSGGAVPCVKHVETTHGNRDNGTTYKSHAYRIVGK